MNTFSRYIFLSLFSFLTLALSAASISFSGASMTPVVVKPEANTGLNDIYVLYNTVDVKAVYTASTSNVTWQRYSNLGGGYAEDVAYERDGNDCSISLGRDDMGYIIQDGDSRYFFWVANYANHQLRLDGISFAENQECDRTFLSLQGDASKITFYTINGQGRELPRDLKLTYTTLVYDSPSESYVESTQQLTLASADNVFGVPAPLRDTEFTIEGDRFLQEWGIAESVTSDIYQAIAVECHTSASQEERDNPNEQKVQANSLGGSAPVEIHFRAAATDAAVFKEWQMSRDPEFEIVDDRYQELDFDYTFRENGTTYVRFVVNNAQGTCEYIGEAYEVFVGESLLQCPNVFSPDASEGVNDEWKVSYKSIISFECHIFNRWGQEMCKFTNPADGWDGKYKGKYVPTGVYYYVIQAQGSDGKKYKLSGDINIIRSKQSITTGENSGVE